MVSDSSAVLRAAVTVEPFWHPVPGGTAVFLAEVLRELHHVEDLDLQGVAARNSAPAPQRFRVPTPVHHSRLARPLLYESWHRFGRPSVESLIGDQVDVIWASAMVVPPRTAPMVVTVHDLDFLHHPERLSARGRIFFPQAWEVTKQRADLVVCPSQIAADDCVAHGIDPAKVRVVHHGVRPAEVAQSAVDQVRAAFSLPEEFLLWVGTIEPRKNLARLVAAVALIPDIPLVIVGPEGWNVDGNEVLGVLGSRAIPIGSVAQSDLMSLYAAATAFVFPSLAEGFGLPVLEAMAHGTPVITSAGTATEEAAGGAAELVDPQDPRSIAAGIEAVLADPDRAQQLTSLGLARAADATWSAAARRYHAIFQEAACMA